MKPFIVALALTLFLSANEPNTKTILAKDVEVGVFVLVGYEWLEVADVVLYFAGEEPYMVEIGFYVDGVVSYEMYRADDELTVEIRRLVATWTFNGYTKNRTRTYLAA